MIKVDRDALVAAIDLTVEKSEWTNLDEKLSFLEELSDKEIVSECKMKLEKVQSIPTPLQNLYTYVGLYVKDNPKKVRPEDRYIMSVFLSYNSSKDLDKKY